MIENKIEITLVDGDIQFTTFKDLKRKHWGKQYLQKYGEIKIERTVLSNRFSVCRIWYKNILMVNNAWRKNDYSFYITKQNEGENIYNFERKKDAIKFYKNDECIAMNAVANDAMQSNISKEKELRVIEQQRLAKAKLIFQKALLNCQTVYNTIINKETFDNEMVSFIYDLLTDEPDRVQKIINNFNQYIGRFILSEKELDNMAKYYTYDYFLQYHSVLSQYCLNEQVLRKIIEDVLQTYIFTPTSFFDKEEIGEELSQMIQNEILSLNKEKLKEQITFEYIKNYFNKVTYKIKDLEYFIEKLESVYSYAISTNNQRQIILDNISTFVDDYLAREEEYYNFVSTYGNDNITINLTAEKKTLFQQYETSNTKLSASQINEYELYKLVMNDYNSIAYGKDGRRNVSISQIPNAVKRFKKLLDTFIENNVICLNTTGYDFVSLNDFDSIAQALIEL